MKAWQEGISAISDWFRANPSARRWVAIAAMLVVLATLIANQPLWGTRSVALFDSRELTADEIGLMQVAFGKSGLNDYEIAGNTIEVPKSLRGDYLRSLSDHGAVPHDLTAHLETRSSFELFQTRDQQRIRQITRKKQTIRDMVMQLRFVDRAIVDYDETRGITPFDEMQRTAVVNVTPSANRMLELPEVKAIRDTVRGAVAGLRAEDITIIDTFASRSHTGATDPASESLPPHVMSKMQAERKYENKIRSALTAYPGIRVNVEVAIDPVVRRVRDERSLDGDAIVVSRIVQRETSARKPAARPSLASHRFDLGANGQAQVQTWNLPREIHSETTESLASGRFETTETAGLAVTSVNVSIGVPERCVRYFVERVPAGKQDSPGERERKRKQVFEQLRDDIRQKVGPLIPGEQDRRDGSPQVVVTMDHEIPVQAAQTSPATAGHWLAGYSAVVGWIALGIVAFLFLRAGPRGPQPGPVSREGTAPDEAVMELPDLQDSSVSLACRPAVSSPQPAADENPHAAPPKTAAQPDATVAAQEKIRIQLDQWCRENPDAAAATIRQWLDKAG